MMPVDPRFKSDADEDYDNYVRNKRDPDTINKRIDELEESLKRNEKNLKVKK